MLKLRKVADEVQNEADKKLLLIKQHQRSWIHTIKKEKKNPVFRQISSSKRENKAKK